MSWLDSREKKEKDNLDSERDEVKRQEQLNRERDPIVKSLEELIKKINILGNGTKNLLKNIVGIKPRQIIERSLVDQNIWSNPIKYWTPKVEYEVKEYPYDIVESIYLFWSLMNISPGGLKPDLFSYSAIPGQSSHNLFNQIIMLHYVLPFESYINNTILEKIYNGGFFLKFSYPLGTKVFAWNSNSDDILKMKSTLEELKNNKAIKYHLWVTDKQFRDSLYGTPESILEIRNDILKEKKKYNDRITKLINAKDIKDVKNTLTPNILNSYKLLTESYRGILNFRRNPLLSKNVNIDDWESIPSNIIASLIVFDSISKIKGYNKREDIQPDNHFSADSQRNSEGYK